MFKLLTTYQIVDPKGQISKSLRADLKRLIRFIFKFKTKLNREEINVLRLSLRCKQLNQTR